MKLFDYCVLIALIANVVMAIIQDNFHSGIGWICAILFFAAKTILQNKKTEP